MMRRAWANAWRTTDGRVAFRFMMLAAVLCIALPALLFAGEPPGDADAVYEDFVRQARSHDPNWCPEEARNRDAAVASYQQALAARPGDPRNIEVENRIAQLYAFYENAATGEKPMPDKAAEVFQHIIDTYPHSQLRWVEANIGLASCSMMTRDKWQAMDLYLRVVEVDPETIAAPLGFDGTREWARTQVAEARVRMVEKVAYAANRIDYEECARLMAMLMEKYKGTAVGEAAREQYLAVLKKVSRTLPVEGTAPPSALATPALVDTSPAGTLQDRPSWSGTAKVLAALVAAGAVLAAAAVALAIVRFRRRADQ